MCLPRLHHPDRVRLRRERETSEHERERHQGQLLDHQRAGVRPRPAAERPHVEDQEDCRQHHRPGLGEQRQQHAARGERERRAAGAAPAEDDEGRHPGRCAEHHQGRRAEGQHSPRGGVDPEPESGHGGGGRAEHGRVVGGRAARCGRDPREPGLDREHEEERRQDVAPLGEPHHRLDAQRMHGPEGRGDRRPDHTRPRADVGHGDAEDRVGEHEDGDRAERVQRQAGGVVGAGLRVCRPAEAVERVVDGEREPRERLVVPHHRGAEHPAQVRRVEPAPGVVHREQLVVVEVQELRRQRGGKRGEHEHHQRGTEGHPQRGPRRVLGMRLLGRPHRRPSPGSARGGGLSLTADRVHRAGRVAEPSRAPTVPATPESTNR